MVLWAQSAIKDYIRAERSYNITPQTGKNVTPDLTILSTESTDHQTETNPPMLEIRTQQTNAPEITKNNNNNNNNKTGNKGGLVDSQPKQENIIFIVRFYVQVSHNIKIRRKSWELV